MISRSIDINNPDARLARNTPIITDVVLHDEFLEYKFVMLKNNKQIMAADLVQKGKNEEYVVTNNGNCNSQ